jgi:anti-sigma28 factor (negative regulator of flagellin synthesis)
MRIDPSLPQPQVNAASTARVSNRATDTGTKATATDSNAGFALTGELASLLAAVRQTPEVRAEVVESIATRVATGEFNTTEAAADAAKALLDDTTE